MSYRICLMLVAALYLLAGIHRNVGAEDAEIPQRHQRMHQLASSFVYTQPRENVHLIERPLFTWSTPERQAVGGELYLWTHNGRPLATIGIWTYDDISDSYELQSLSEDGLQVSSPVARDWSPQVGGLNFIPLPDAPQPENSAIRRQTQLRSLIRSRFSAEVKLGTTQQVVNLRLLTQPLYRYDPLPEAIIDGAVFAFAMGTDPEVLVAFEARQVEGKPVWYYAFAPATSAPVRGFLDAVAVWNNDDQRSNDTFRMVMRR